MADCYRGHRSPRDRQRRCIECRRGYDLGRKSAERMRRFRRTPAGAAAATRAWRRKLQAGMTRKEQLIRELQAQLGISQQQEVA